MWEMGCLVELGFTFVGIGRPEGCFLPIFILAHPRQIDIKVFDCIL
jgi:hypothetical protein